MSKHRGFYQMIDGIQIHVVGDMEKMNEPDIQAALTKMVKLVSKMKFKPEPKKRIK
jgi:hypothetical protein